MIYQYTGGPLSGTVNNAPNGTVDRAYSLGAVDPRSNLGTFKLCLRQGSYAMTGSSVSVCLLGAGFMNLT